MTITYPLSLPAGMAPASVSIMASDVVSRSESPFTYQEQVQRHQGQRWVISLEYPQLSPELLDQWAAMLLRLKGQFGTVLIGDPSKAVPAGVATGTPVVDAPTVSLNTNATSTLATLNFASTTGIRDGMSASGTNIASGSKVVSHTSTTVTLNYAVSASVSSGTAITFSGMQGDYLYTRGWTANVTGILKAGDYVQIGTGTNTTLYRLTSDATSDSSGYAALEVWPQVRQNPAPPADATALILTNTVGRFRLDKSTGWKITPPIFGAITLTAHEAL